MLRLTAGSGRRRGWPPPASRSGTRSWSSGWRWVSGHSCSGTPCCRGCCWPPPRYRRTGDARSFAAVVLWSALGSLTPTGGLFAMAAVVAGGASRAPAVWCWCSPVAAPPAALGGAVAGRRRRARRPTPRASRCSRPGSDASGHPALALLGLGGIWDGLSVPDTPADLAGRGGHRAGRRRARGRRTPLVGVPRPTSRRAWPCSASVGLAARAGSDHRPRARTLLRHAVTSVPGVGLLRDGQKLLAPFVVLVACLFGAAVDVAASRASTRYGDEVVASVGRPGRAAPDRAGARRRRVRSGAPCSPVRFPPALDPVATTVDAGPPGPALVTLPWRSYRNFSWGTGYPSSDPLVRMVDRPVITSEDLDRRRPRSSAARAAWRHARRRARRGATAPTCCPVVRRRLGGGVRRRPGRAATSTWRVSAGSSPAPSSACTPCRARPRLPGPAAWRRAAVVGADLLALLMVLAAAVGRRLGVANEAWRRARRPAVLESPQPRSGGELLIRSIVAPLVGVLLASGASLGLVYSRRRRRAPTPPTRRS